MKLYYPDFLLNAEVKVYTQKLNDESMPIEELIYEGKCQHVIQSKQMIDEHRQLQTITGWVVIKNDIDVLLNDRLVVEVGGQKKKVFRINKPTDLDGSVFSTELFLT